MSSRRRSIVPQSTSTPYIANDDEVERSKRRTNSELQRRVSCLGVANRSGVASDNEGVGFVNYNEVEMSPRRRSIVPQSTSTPYIANDDEVERFKRRTISELQKRVSSLGVANRSGIASDNEEVELNESTLQDHYQTCVKLFTENKINAKNAWNVHIVEYMQAMIKKDLVMKDALKLATTSIDIGCKVYCLKVDQVHSDLFKLASAMARVNMEENENRENDNNDAGDVATDEQVDANKKKEKKKKRVRKNFENQDCELTVVTDESLLNGIIVPHNTAIQQVSSGKNRLNTLSMITKQKWGFEQMVNCRSKFPYFTPLDSNTENIKICDQKVPVVVPSPRFQLCPSFTNFIIDRWQPDDDDVPMGTQPVSNLTQNNIVYDDNGLPIPDLDASMPDNADNGFDDAEEIVETAVGHAEIRQPVAFITEMRPGQGPLSDVPLQYSYRSPPVVSDRYQLSGVWAGPSHWKIKALQRRTAVGDTESVNAVPQRGRRAPKKSEPEILNFFQESDIEEEALVPIRKNKKKKRVRRTSLSKVTLPEDLGITRDDLCRLKHKPGIRINIENGDEANSARTSHVNLNITGIYQYDNPDDADYCSQTINDNADVDDQNESNHDNNENNDVLHQTLTEENMVNMPSQVQKFYLPYATQAKRMDMRKLKDAIWKTMAIQETGDECIGHDSEKLRTVTLDKVPFSKMYEALPAHIPNRMSEELSFPLAFVALLHLANEETLKLKGTPELNDIFVSTDK